MGLGYSSHDQVWEKVREVIVVVRITGKEQAVEWLICSLIKPNLSALMEEYTHVSDSRTHLQHQVSHPCCVHVQLMPPSLSTVQVTSAGGSAFNVDGILCVLQYGVVTSLQVIEWASFMLNVVTVRIAACDQVCLCFMLVHV